jgi:hypothetical protein
LGQNITPNANPLRIAPYERDQSTRSAETGDLARGGPSAHPNAEDVSRLRQSGVHGDARPRVVLQFPSDPKDMLLSGTLANGEVLANRAAVLDQRLGQGHVLMFAIRPFWRWQTHGTYPLGFNAILNWNDLGAGAR